METKRKKTKDVHVRLTPEDYYAAQKVAELTGRSIGSLMGYTLQRYMTLHYPNAYGNRALQHEFSEQDMAAANGE